MRQILVCFVVMLSVFPIIGQNQDQMFADANTAYQNGKFEEAIETYHKILDSGNQSADVYYNLGNAYFKRNALAPSIYNYERALMLNPSHQDAQNNLAFAKRSTIDVIEPLPKTLFQKINDTLIFPISYNVWAWIAVVFAFISSALFILYYFSQFTFRKKLFFIGSFLSLGLFLLTLTAGIFTKHHYNKNQPAIVFAKQTSVNNEPMTQATENFVLHEGTKVQVLEDNNDWYKIAIADGKKGWIPKETVKLLK